MTLLYPIGKSLYVNITNLCCCKCVFCVRDITDSVGGSDSLWLDHEPTMDELKAELEKFDLDDYEEVVFCGYGEPLMRINEVVEFATYIKSKKDIKIRINTNGLADLIHKKKTAVMLKDVIEEALSFIPQKERKEAVKKSCARTFQALRIDVNNEFEVLYEFLEKLPDAMAPGGRVAILTFHSGEDRLVKKAFKALYKQGIFSEIAKDVIRPSAEECNMNPRARSTKMRWAIKN